DPSRISPLFSASKLTDLYRAADVIQTLEAITAEVRVQGTEKAVALIQKTSEECESLLLMRFEEAMEKNQWEEMRAMTRTLLGFKGKNVIKRYVFAAMQRMEEN